MKNNIQHECKEKEDLDNKENFWQRTILYQYQILGGVWTIEDYEYGPSYIEYCPYCGTKLQTPPSVEDKPDASNPNFLKEFDITKKPTGPKE